MTGTWFRTGDLDESTALVNQVYYEVAVEPARGPATPFRFGMNFDTAGPLTFGILNYGSEVTVRAGGLDMTYSVALPLKGRFPMHFGNQEVLADPFTAAVTSPTTHVTYRSFPTGTEQLFVLAFSQEHLDNHLRTLLGRDRIGAIDLAPSLDVRTGLGAQWWRMASALAVTLQSPSGLVANPLMTAQMSSALTTGLLLATDHRYRDDLGAWTRPAPPPAIRRASEIIESRAHEPLTIPEVAAEIGCSIRALQAGYRRHLDMTPREHLGRVRIERAHAMLESANPGSITVAEIAAMWGFRQPGRFATEYRKVYGISPRTTLRKR